MDRDDNDAAIVLVKTYGEVQMGAGKSCCVAQTEHFHENRPRKVAERTIHTSSGHVHNYIGGYSGNVFHKVLILCAILHALKIFRTILVHALFFDSEEEKIFYSSFIFLLLHHIRFNVYFSASDNGS